MAILVAIAVNEDGYREVLGAAEGMKEDKASWVSFFQWLKGRGLDGVKLIVGDKCLGMLEAVGEVFPDAKYQRCTVHFYRNVFSVVPCSKVKLGAAALSAGCTQLLSYVIYFSVCTPNLDHTSIQASSFGITRANLKRVFYKTAYSQSK